jgi:hypothetical protein
MLGVTEILCLYKLWNSCSVHHFLQKSTHSIENQEPKGTHPSLFYFGFDTIIK